MKRTVQIVLCSLLIALVLGFIFHNSMESIPDSAEKSLAVGGHLTPILEFFVGKGNVTDHLVRKLAHFCEFGALGVSIGLLQRVIRAHWLYSVFGSLLAALSDETIQIFYERGSQVADVWLDFSGALTGLAGIFILGLIVRAVRKPRAKERL